MRIVFMGSADLSCLCLRALIREGRHTVAAVVTQPDRPSGRRLAVRPCAAKQEAVDAGLWIMAPVDVNSSASVDGLRALKPDAIVVVAYGQILKPDVLTIPPRGCINVHYSLLPRHRGAAPIQWAIARGDHVTGVTAMYMDERMDTGDIIRQVREPISDHDTGALLHDRLGPLGAQLLVETLSDIESGDTSRMPQDDAAATSAPKLRKADGRIDWTLPARSIYNRIRAFDPWPGCYCVWPGSGGRTMRVFGARVVASAGGEPGTVSRIGLDGPVVETGEGALLITKVQPEGGRRMPASAYLRGHPACAGDRLD